MRRLTSIAVLVFMAAATLGGCKTDTSTKGKTAASAKPKVVATFSILGDLVGNVAGDKVELITLVGPDADTHNFEPKPSQAASVADAVIIFENGVGLEHWLDGLYKSSSSKAKRVVVTKGITLLEGSDDDDKKGDKKKSKDEDKDPHVWSDVKNGIHMVGLIRDSLVEVDPANAEHYKSNAKIYLKKLEDLDAWVSKEVDKLPKDQRKLVTNHDTLNYFAKRYGFEIIGDALGSTSTAEVEPSAKDTAKLVEKIKAAKVPVIFAENIESNKVIKRLAQEAGVRIGPELYSDALGKADSAGGTYEKMVHHNVSAIVGELSKK